MEEVIEEKPFQLKRFKRAVYVAFALFLSLFPLLSGNVSSDFVTAPVVVVWVLVQSALLLLLAIDLSYVFIHLRQMPRTVFYGAVLLCLFYLLDLLFYLVIVVGLLVYA